MVISNKPIFAPFVAFVGYKWREMIVPTFTIGGEQHVPTYLYPELLGIDYKAGEVTIQYWLQGHGNVKGGLVSRPISELPVIEGDIDSSYHGSFSSKDNWAKQLQSYDEFESVTAEADDESVTAASGGCFDDESVTAASGGCFDDESVTVCPICGKSFDRYARSDKKFCGATCRKRNERKQKNHEKEMLQAERFFWSLEKEDLRRLQAIISQRLQNIG